MNSIDTSLDERIRSFASAVREHLSDLPDDEVDDIIIGLTADLTEQAADDGGVLELGDPTVYAQELRTAAGLPDRAEVRRREPVSVRLSARRKAWADGIRRSAFGAWMLDLLISLRPVWWVLRGFGMFVLVTQGPLGAWIPFSPASWFLVLALMIVSVQWGRGLWLPKNWLRHIRTVMSIVTVVLLPITLSFVLTPRVEYVDDGSYVPSGLLLDGVQVGNIFAYDPDGNLIEQVQLYTGKGTPLNIFGGSSAHNQYGWQDDDEKITVPFRDSRGLGIWNIYPLNEAELNHNTGEVRESTIKPATPPFVRAPGLLTPSPSPTPTPGETDAETDDSAETPAP